MIKITPFIPNSLNKDFDVPEKIASWQYCKEVNSYSELRRHIAELSCANKNYILFFRGQSDDYINLKSGKSSLLPTLYRSFDFTLSKEELQFRWKKLKLASDLLKRNYESKRRIEIRKQLVKWSILQHYEVTETPLIDVTQSLKVACSFAVLSDQNKIEKDGSKNKKEHQSEDKYAYLYVLALPYYTNRISVNSEEYLTNIRLISIAPPDALRPHYQEGFLVGEDEFKETYSRKDELDLNNRLVAKFKFKNNLNFWDEGLPLQQKELYPKDDKIEEKCKKVIDDLYNELASTFNEQDENFNISGSQFQSYMKKWAEIETLLFSNINNATKFKTVAGLINDIPDQELQNKLKTVRKIRNALAYNKVDEPTKKLLKEWKWELKEEWEELKLKLTEVIEQDKN